MSVFLHSDVKYTSEAIWNLLQETETEIGKRFSEDGILVPFAKKHHESYHDLYMPLHRKVLDDLDTGTSVTSEQSGSSFADTPTSSVAEADAAERDAPSVIECFREVNKENAKQDV